MCSNLLFVTASPLRLGAKRPRSAPNRLPLSTRLARACAADDLSRKVKDSLLDAPPAPQTAAPTFTPPPLPVQRDLLTYRARVLARRPATRATAEAMYLRVLQQDPTDGRAWLGLARLHIKSGRPAQARAAFRDGARASRGNAHLLQAWGVFEERSGSPNRARALFLAAVRADETHCASWVALGLWWQRHGRDLDRASDAFAHGAEADPSNYYVWHAWGVLERERGRFRSARECFAKGVAANPRNGATYVVWGVLEDGLGRSEEAFRLFNKAHKVAPKNAHAFVSHAVAAERAGRVQEARSLLRRAQAVRPSDPAPLQALALLEFRAGRVEAARALFRDGARVSRTHAPLWHAWACVESASGNLPRARELFQEAVWAAPWTSHVVRTFHAWARLELGVGQIVRARAYVAHGLAVDAKSPALLALLAGIEAREGYIGRARALFERALVQSPRARFLWREYEQIEKDAGHPDRAAVVFERSVVAAQIVEQRLTVSPPLAGDFASAGMWIGEDDLQGQDAAIVRPTKAGEREEEGEAQAFGEQAGPPPPSEKRRRSAERRQSAKRQGENTDRRNSVRHRPGRKAKFGQRPANRSEQSS